jgi:uncharacterized caspase-like protein
MKRPSPRLITILLVLQCLGVGQNKQIVPPVDSGKKTALVIGNSLYALGALKNPPNDAADMRLVLSQKGFQVEPCCDDAGLKQLTDAIDHWTAKLHTGDTALFYYSGHGVRVGNIDYIEPVDFRASSEADVPYVAYSLNRLVDKMQERGTKANLIILDACRNNPYLVAKSSQQGLAGVTASTGTLILFAAAEGKTASDNDAGRNSLFTATSAARPAGLSSKLLDQAIISAKPSNSLSLGLPDSTPNGLFSDSGVRLV